MKNENFKRKFPSIDETQILNNEMMDVIESGSSCEQSCKKSCQPGNKGSAGTDIDIQVPSQD